tara:strand:- start:212 stop:421 length:210 start_codon:yes stop_codon:yes gene_type:complete
MTSEKHFLKQYLNTVVELSNETGMSKKESRDVLDIALSNKSPASVNFNEIKTELKTFITINLFSLICKL